jgi:hypothetical protein
MLPTCDANLTRPHSRHGSLSGDYEEQLSALSEPFLPAITSKKVRSLTEFNFQLTD